MSLLTGQLILWLLAVSSVQAASPESSDRSLRSVERMRFDCSSELGRRELTLFGNGTVRVRQGVPGEELMWLDELGPDELDAYIRRFLEEDVTETPNDYSTVQGEWVEQCSLRMELPGRLIREFHFGRYDSLSLQLQRLVAVSLDILDGVDLEGPAEGQQQLPPDYSPRVGDILRRVDGVLFEIVAFTGDQQGLELQGLEQPITMYLLGDQVRRNFMALESRRRR